MNNLKIKRSVPVTFTNPIKIAFFKCLCQSFLFATKKIINAICYPELGFKNWKFQNQRLNLRRIFCLNCIATFDNVVMLYSLFKRYTYEVTKPFKNSSQGKSPEHAESKSSKAKTNTQSNEMPIGAVLTDFSQKTTIHGIPFIGGTKGFRLRLFWSLVTIAGFIGFVWQLRQLCCRYLEFPVSQSVEVRTIYYIIFSLTPIVEKSLASFITQANQLHLKQLFTLFLKHHSFIWNDRRNFFFFKRSEKIDLFLLALIGLLNCAAIQWACEWRHSLLIRSSSTVH